MTSVTQVGLSTEKSFLSDLLFQEVLIAHWVEHLTNVVKVKGSNPTWNSDFSQLLQKGADNTLGFVCFHPIAQRASNNHTRNLMVSALDTGSSGPGSGPGRGHYVVFLGKTFYSHSASLHPGV